MIHQNIYLYFTLLFGEKFIRFKNMLSSIIKQHQSHQQARNEEQEKNRKEAMLASNELTQGFLLIRIIFIKSNRNYYFSSSRSP